MSKEKHYDCQQRMLFGDRNIRGEFVHIKQCLEDVCKNHDYSLIEKQLIGQIMCAAVLLASLLKFEGSLSLQLQSESAVKLALVQVDHQGHIRALLTRNEKFDSLNLLQIAKDGQMLVSLQSTLMKDPYQSLIPITYASLAENIESYFKMSEQLETALWFHHDETSSAGFLLQKLPNMDDDIYWKHVLVLAATLTADEMLNLPFANWLYRLFHQEQDIELFTEKALQFQCRCSKERLLNTLAMLGADELNDIIKEQGEVAITCDFCCTQYIFNKAQIQHLLDGDQKVLH